MSDSQKRVRTALWILFFIAAVAIGFFTKLYPDMDNYYIAVVKASGGYCAFLGPGINALMTWLWEIFPQVEVFSFVQMVFTFLGLGWLAYLFSKNSERLAPVLLGEAILLALSIFHGLAHCNFTVTAAFFTAVGWISVFFYLQGQSGISGFLVGFFYLFLGNQWRQSSFLLALPFAFVSFAYELFFAVKKKDREWKKRAVIFISAFFILFSSLYVLEQATAAKRKEYIRYNSLRSSLFDYETPDYSEIKNESAGLDFSENDYEALRDLILADTETVDIEFFEKVRFAVDAYGGQNSRSVRQAIVLLKNTFLSGYLYLQMGGILLLYLVLFISRKELRLYLFLCGMGCACILAWLAYRGRLPTRVVLAVLYAFSIPIMLHLRDFRGKLTVPTLLASVFLVGAAFHYYGKTESFCRPQLPINNREEVCSSAVSRFCNNDTYYLWSVYDEYSVARSDFLGNGMLPPEDYRDNNTVDGSWNYGQDYYMEELKQNGMENPMKSLIFKDNWEYVGSQGRMEVVLRWLQEHYDPGTTVVQVEAFGPTIIWKFSAGSVLKK